MRISTASTTTIGFAALLGCSDDTRPIAPEAELGDASSPAHTPDAAPTHTSDAAATGTSTPDADARAEATIESTGTIAARGVITDVALSPTTAVLGLAFLRSSGLGFRDVLPPSTGIGDFELALASMPTASAYAEAASASFAGDGLLAIARVALLPPGHADALVVGEGGAQNGDTPGPYVALSDNAIVVWSDHAIAHTSLFSRLIGLGEDLPAGYTLVALGEPRWSEDTGAAPGVVCVGGECVEPYMAEAYARFNMLHGTRYTVDEGVPEGPEHAQQRDEIDAISLQLAIDHGIDIASRAGTRLVHAGEGRFDVSFVGEPRDLY